MMTYDIVPHVGIGPIRLGMSRDEVLDVMRHLPGAYTRHDSRDDTDYFFANCFQVSYDPPHIVSFIEVADCETIRFHFQGIDVFDIEAKELVAFISQVDQFDPELSDEGSEYVFPRLILTLWDPDPQYDHRGSVDGRAVFAAVGIGDETYLRAISTLKNH